MKIYGVDFTCAPRRAKPITAAVGVLSRQTLKVEGIERLESFASFETFLASPGPWIGGFDFPFSLPRELVRDLGWPSRWPALVKHCASFTRIEFRKILDDYRATRPPGSKYAHRATDLPAGSSSPMKLVNPPVALMFHEAVPRLLASDVCIPGLLERKANRVALEAYPGLLVRKQLGLRASYKSDTRSEHTPERRALRKKVFSALLEGRPLGVKIEMNPKIARQVVDDGSGDLLDATICAVQAAWAAKRPRYGLPEDVPEGEGWILSA